MLSGSGDPDAAGVRDPLGAGEGNCGPAGPLPPAAVRASRCDCCQPNGLWAWVRSAVRSYLEILPSLSERAQALEQQPRHACC